MFVSFLYIVLSFGIFDYCQNVISEFDFHEPNVTCIHIELDMDVLNGWHDLDEL